MTTRKKSSGKVKISGDRRATGVLTSPRTKLRTTRLQTINAPGQKKRDSSLRMAGLRTVNAPGSKRKSLGATGAHVINAPRGHL